MRTSSPKAGYDNQLGTYVRYGGKTRAAGWRDQAESRREYKWMDKPARVRHCKIRTLDVIA